MDSPGPCRGAFPGNLPLQLTSFVGRDRELNTIAQTAPVREAIAPDGSLPRAISAEEFGTLVRTSFNTYKKIAKEKNIVAD